MRKVWLALKTPLTLLVLLAFTGTVAWWGFREAVKPIPERPPTPCEVIKIGPNFTAQNAYVRLLNGTSRSNLSKNTKLIFGNAGFKVIRVANAKTPAAKTFIAGVDANSPEVQLVRSYFPANTPFVADATKYQDHVVDVVLGDDYSAKMIQAKPKTSVPLKDGTACSPAKQYPGGAVS